MRPPASTYSRCGYMDGSRFRCAKLAIRGRFANPKGFGSTTIACARWLVTAEKARSKSSAWDTSTDCGSRRRAGRTLRSFVVEHRAPDVGIPEHRDAGEPG